LRFENHRGNKSENDQDAVPPRGKLEAVLRNDYDDKSAVDGETLRVGTGHFF